MAREYERIERPGAPEFGPPDTLAGLLVKHGCDVLKVQVARHGRGGVDFRLPQATNGRFKSSVWIDESGRVNDYTVRTPLLDMMGRSEWGIGEQILTVAENAETEVMPREVRVDEHNGMFAPHIEAYISEDHEKIPVREFGNYVGAIIEEYDRVGPEREVQQP